VRKPRCKVILKKAEEKPDIRTAEFVMWYKTTCDKQMKDNKNVKVPKLLLNEQCSSTKIVRCKFVFLMRISLDGKESQLRSTKTDILRCQSSYNLFRPCGMIVNLCCKMVVF